MVIQIDEQIQFNVTFDLLDREEGLRMPSFTLTPHSHGAPLVGRTWPLDLRPGPTGTRLSERQGKGLVASRRFKGCEPVDPPDSGVFRCPHNTHGSYACRASTRCGRCA